MGIYLDSTSTYTMYTEVYQSPYFVDKSTILEDIFPRIDTSEKFICVTRPRRFGKSVMADMIASFFSKGCDTSKIFDTLNIANSRKYHKYLNNHHVIHISFNEIPRRCKSYDNYIGRIEQRLINDLANAYPHIEINDNEAVWDVLFDIYNANENAKFIFVFDEWDYIFHRDFVTTDDKKDYIDFLSNLLKGKPYVSLAYMTGILPIAKYSSGSELNMFLEYTMASETMFSDYYGFTESEVDVLFSKYLKKQIAPKITRDELRCWYNGYHTHSNVHVYNPRSVVAALTNNQLGNYWTNSGPYDELFYYVRHNIDAVRDDIAFMIAGIPVPAKVCEYAATSMNLMTKDEIFSAMVVYGFLSYINGFVNIPNKELMDKFNEMLQKEKSLGYIHLLAKESERLLNATLTGDSDTVCKILEYTHNTEIPLLNYNNETDLTAVIALSYLSARDLYTVEREEKSGIGYVDFLFTPFNKKADCIILELKVDDTPENAVQQIKNRQYALRFMPKLGETCTYTGRILAVGIAYYKNTKEHKCKIEILRNAL